MKTAKKFDCVQFKDRLQARQAERLAGLTGAQARQRIRRELATSQSPVAKLWRSLGKHPAKSR
ncbi:MAG: hypothetical protein PHU85_08020 [Phycisphaerae bacterium]|nr:hypothetical protein [Phycisphaerae bacterium]